MGYLRFFFVTKFRQERQSVISLSMLAVKSQYKLLRHKTKLGKYTGFEQTVDITVGGN